MIYLDTNVFIYAIEQHPEYGQACKAILQKVQDGKLSVACSQLVLVEVISVLKKLNSLLVKGGKTPLDIRANVDAILSLPVTWFELNVFIIKRAAEYDYSISGVDYIHAATMEVNNISTLISADRDFDKVDFVKRRDPLQEA